MWKKWVLPSSQVNRRHWRSPAVSSWCGHGSNKCRKVIHVRVLILIGIPDNPGIHSVLSSLIATKRSMASPPVENHSFVCLEKLMGVDSGILPKSHFLVWMQEVPKGAERVQLKPEGVCLVVQWIRVAGLWNILNLSKSRGLKGPPHCCTRCSQSRNISECKRKTHRQLIYHNKKVTWLIMWSLSLMLVSFLDWKRMQ